MDNNTLKNLEFILFFSLESCVLSPWSVISTEVENVRQIHLFLCKTNPIFAYFSPKTTMSPKNKPNSKPIQTQFAKKPKMMQIKYLQGIKKKNADWLYSKQSQFKPNLVLSGDYPCIFIFTLYNLPEIKNKS